MNYLGGISLKNKNQSKTKFFSIIASLLMLFSLITPGLVNAESIGKSNGYVNKTETNAKEKLSNGLASEFKKDEKVSFLIKFKEKADTAKVVQRVKKQAKKSKLSAHRGEFVQRSAVISELKTTADKEQQTVIKYLEQEEAKGNVESIKPYFIVNGISVTATKEVAEKVAAFSEVEKVLPNETRQLFTTQTIGKGLTTDIANVEWNVERIGAPSVWDMGIEGTGVVVASIDSGVQWDHPALKEKYRGYNSDTGEVDHNFNWFDSTTGKSEPYDDIAHGTHVTGTMVGSELDGSNKIGVAPGAKWIAVKAFSAEGGSDADILAAAEWILAPTDEDGNTRVDLAPDIVNNSWGGGPGLDEWYRDVVIEWRNAGIFPAFAAGNTDMFNPGGPGSVANPANYPESFAVGATDSNDIVGNFSLRGPSPYGEIKPDISAPGANIRSSIPGGKYDDGWDGTSMAAPAVSGVIALLYEVDASLTVAEIEEILLTTATTLTDEEYPESPNHGYGHGLINAFKAVSLLRDGLGTVEGTVVQNLEESGMPISGKVSVLESRQYVNTNPEDGSYTLSHGIGEFTIQAEAYGYQSKQQVVAIKKDNVLQADFVLEEIPKGNISGTITNEITGEVIEGIALNLVEDANIAPVETDENGNYQITAFEGTYTMKLTATGYHSKEIEVMFKEDNQVIDVSLKPLFTYPGGELGYDNGIIDNGSMYFGSGAGWAVKMTLPENKDSAIVTEGLFHFIDKGFSDTRGTEFSLEVWDATGAGGKPGKKLAGPIAGEAVYKEWTVVDLTDEQIIVDGDFYMVYVQTMEYPTAPGLGTDDGNPYMDRSFQYLDGGFYPAFVEDGNYMIRARISYDIEKPFITSPAQHDVFEEAKVNVEGTASPTTMIKLMNNNKEVGTAKVGEDGKFTVPVELSQGENKLIAISTLDNKVTGQSDSVSVLLITEKPIIEELKPETNQFLVPGEKVEVSFRSNVIHGEGNFKMMLPAQKDLQSTTGNSMEEVEPGVYKGIWTVPANLDLQGAIIQAELTDAIGQKVIKEAKGKLYISQNQLDRISGEDRYLTAIETSKKGWTKSDTVVITRGDDFADALTGVPLAFKLDAPVLLTLNNKLYKETMNEIKRLGAKNVVILGGQSAISDSITKELEKVGLEVKRIAGANRFETAAKIASEVAPDGAGRVVVANGMDFPDALSVASHAAKEGLPILLTQTNKIPKETLDAVKVLEATESLVVGGNTVVSAEVAKQLPKATRLAGADRYETNIEIAKHFGVQGKRVYVATGKTYADALTGAVLAAKNESAVLLVHDRVPEVVTTYVSNQDIKRLTIFGGESAVSSKVASELEKLIK